MTYLVNKPDSMTDKNAQKMIYKQNYSKTINKNSNTKLEIKNSKIIQDFGFESFRRFQISR